MSIIIINYQYFIAHTCSFQPTATWPKQIVRSKKTYMQMTFLGTSMLPERMTIGFQNICPEYRFHFLNTLR